MTALKPLASEMHLSRWEKDMWGKRRETLSETSPHADVQKFFSSVSPAPVELVAAPAPGALSQPESGVADQVARQLGAVSATAPETLNEGSPQHEAIAVQAAAPNGSRLIRANPVSTAFGDMVALLAKSSAHKHFSLSDLEWLLLPPVALNQFALADAKLPGGQTVLAGFALWAKVAPDVDARLSQAQRYPVRLLPNEWRSGDINWIIDAVGNSKIVRNLVAQLTKNTFRDKPFKILMADREEVANRD